jgi:hypothetical protein
MAARATNTNSELKSKKAQIGAKNLRFFFGQFVGDDPKNNNDKI